MHDAYAIKYGMICCSIVPLNKCEYGPAANTTTSSPPCVSSDNGSVDGDKNEKSFIVDAKSDGSERWPIVRVSGLKLGPFAKLSFKYGIESKSPREAIPKIFDPRSFSM